MFIFLGQLGFYLQKSKDKRITHLYLRDRSCKGYWKGQFGETTSSKIEMSVFRSYTKGVEVGADGLLRKSQD